MKLVNVEKVLNIVYRTFIRQNDWNEAQEALSSQASSFFNHDFIQKSCSEINISNELCAEFLQTGRIINQNSGLVELFLFYYYVLFFREEHLVDSLEWSIFPKGLTMFYAFVFLAGVVKIKEFYHARNIPQSILVQTLADLELWVRDYKTKNGVWGLTEGKWLAHHFRGNLFQLGRLQFRFEPFFLDYRGFRGINAHKVILLAPPGMKILPDGHIEGNAECNKMDGERSCYREDNLAVVGNPVTRNGKLLKDPVSLLKKEWALILQKNDPALSFHIPATGPLVYADCGDSFREADIFFKKYFPEKKIRCFFSHSWLYDNQLKQYLREDANILRFQKEFQLYPLPDSTDDQLFDRVFGKRYQNYSEAPQITTLQKAVIHHLEKGGRWRKSGALFFEDDLIGMFLKTPLNPQ